MQSTEGDRRRDAREGKKGRRTSDLNRIRAEEVRNAWMDSHFSQWVLLLLNHCSRKPMQQLGRPFSIWPVGCLSLRLYVLGSCSSKHLAGEDNLSIFYAPQYKETRSRISAHRSFRLKSSCPGSIRLCLPSNISKDVRVDSSLIYHWGDFFRVRYRIIQKW